jgi:hypothetical protein
MKTSNDYYIDIVKDYNKLLVECSNLDLKIEILEQLTGMKIEELIEAIKSGKVVV